MNLLNKNNDCLRKIYHYVPWIFFIDKGVVFNKTGSFQKTLEYKPISFNDDHEQLRTTNVINETLKALGSNWAYFFEVQHNQVETNGYKNQYYITIVYMPPLTFIDSFFDEKEKNNYLFYLNYFLNEIQTIVKSLKNVLSYIRYLNDADTLTYLHSCISINRGHISVPEVPLFLDYVLADNILECGITPKLGNFFLGIITINGHHPQTFSQIIKDLDKIDVEYRFSTRLILMDDKDTVSELESYTKKFFVSRKGIWSILKDSIKKKKDNIEDNALNNETIPEKCINVKEFISDLSVKSGYYSSCIVIWDDDLEVLKSKTSQIENIVNNIGIITIAETYNSVPTWLSSIPGHCWANLKRPLVLSLELHYYFII